MTFRIDLQSHIPAMRRFARGLARDREIADDLVQETLLRALRAEHRWNGGPMLVWLFTILGNLNRNRLRSLARRGTHEPLAEADKLEGAGPTTGESRDVERALAELSVEHREVLLLVAVEGFSYRETAESLGVPPGTVMSRLSRARAAFKASLEREAGRPAPHLRVIK